LPNGDHSSIRGADPLSWAVGDRAGRIQRGVGQVGDKEPVASRGPDRCPFSRHALVVAAYAKIRRMESGRPGPALPDLA